MSRSDANSPHFSPKHALPPHPGADNLCSHAILNGRRAITGDTALRLGHFFGTSPQFWLNPQTLYDLRLAEKRAGKSIRRLPTLRSKAA